MNEHYEDDGSNTGPATRKKMRKGTQSCIECRRRKIRCTFKAGRSICTPCSTRGTRCIDQRDADHVIPEEDKVTLRDRVVRLESVLLNHMQTADKVSSPELLDDELDNDVAIDVTLHRPPFVSALDKAELLGTKEYSLTPGDTDSTSQSSLHGSGDRSQSATVTQTRLQPNKASSRDAKACQALRSLLPDYDTIIEALERNGEWWRTFRFKTGFMLKQDTGLLTAFARDAYTSNNPTTLAQLVVAYGRSAFSKGHLLSVVDSLVLTDNTYALTVGGIECALLLSKCYIDTGQPRRAWLIARKGISFCQLLGFDRQHSSSAHGSRLFWALYHGERFTSLMLGLPSCVNDSMYPVSPTQLAVPVDEEDESQPLQRTFARRCTMLTGKIIERNISSDKPSFAQTMAIDEEMEQFYMTMPPEWWLIPSAPVGPEVDRNKLCEQLILQLTFFHNRAYLHMPFVVSGQGLASKPQSKILCMEAASEMIRRHIALVTPLYGEPLFDCQSTVFISFIMAVVLILGLAGSRELVDAQTSQEYCALIEAVQAIIEAQQKLGCKTSEQCAPALECLLHPNSTSNAASVQLPYFGSVIKRQTPPSQDTVAQIETSRPRKSPEPSYTGMLDPRNDASMPNILPGVRNGGSGLENLQSGYWEFDDFGAFDIENVASFEGPPTMDLDQDWESWSTQITALPDQVG